MPIVETGYFGGVQYGPDSVIEFPIGLPGFDQERRFVLIEQAIHRPIVFLQSLSRPELCFLTLPVGVVDPHYRLSMAAEDLQLLALSPERQPRAGEVVCLAIVALREGGPPTANLLSPVVVELKSRRAVQAVRPDGAYSHQQPLAEGSSPCS